MYKLIVVVVLVISFTVSESCDAMKEFEEDVMAMKTWGEAKCKDGHTLTDAEIKQVKDCYTENVQTVFTSDNAKVLDKAVMKNVFDNPDIKNVCKSEVQNKIKSAMIKEVGIMKAKDCKKELDADCPKFKKAFDAYSACVKG